MATLEKLAPIITAVNDALTTYTLDVHTGLFEYTALVLHSVRTSLFLSESDEYISCRGSLGWSVK